MRLVALVIVALALWTSLGQAGVRGAGPTTRLTIVALDSYVGRAVFHLSCEPVGGDLPDATRACAALAQKPQLITNPEPFTCRGGPGSWWLVKVTGALHGEAISRTFVTCWTLQAPTLAQLGLTWDVLTSHLVPRRHKRVAAGTTRRFAPGVLRETDLVTCDIRGYHLKVGVPEEAGRPVSVSAGTYPVVTLTVDFNRDGSVTASCRRVKRANLSLAPLRSPLPEDIAVGLTSIGIEARDANEVKRGSSYITARRAVAIARRNFGGMARPYSSGWQRVGRVTVHLVRVVSSNSVGKLGLFPDQLAWLVVIRDVTVPILGPPGRPGPLSYIGTLAVFVRTDVPSYIVAIGF